MDSSLDFDQGSRIEVRKVRAPPPNGMEPELLFEFRTVNRPPDVFETLL